MITLYDNPFSPFARKVRLVLGYKGLGFESIDALALAEHERLATHNPRAEVPVLVDGELCISESADIVAYIEDRYPQPSVFPVAPEARVKARRWQRIADTILDSIIHDISIWMWPTHRRPDQPPAGLIEAGQRDLARLLQELEGALGEDGFVCGEISIADFALFPHISAMKTLGVSIDEQQLPRVCAWNRSVREQVVVRNDQAYVKRSAMEKFATGSSPYESSKIVWRGDRIEWLFHNGFHNWWFAELAAGRVVIPSALP